MKTESVIFGGGCFWCTEAVFKRLKGVMSVTPGYAGGETKDNRPPTYEKVATGFTDFAEVIKVDYDPKVVSFDDLLIVFFATHDPTTLNRQGNDIGTQYRSMILYSTLGQRHEIKQLIKILDEGSDKKIVTEVKPIREFYPAEGEHLDYYDKNKDKPYCQLVISPKLDKLKERFAQLLKESNE